MAVAANYAPSGKLLKDGDLVFRTKSVEEALAPLIEQVRKKCSYGKLLTLIKMCMKLPAAFESAN